MDGATRLVRRAGVTERVGVVEAGLKTRRYVTGSIPNPESRIPNPESRIPDPWPPGPGSTVYLFAASAAAFSSALAPLRMLNNE